MGVVLVQDRSGMTSCTVGPIRRLQARVLAGRLDRALAAGAPPDEYPLLAVRARKLVRRSSRRSLASALRRVADRAEHGNILSPCLVPVCRPRVCRCLNELRALAGRLEAPGPISPQAVACAQVLVTDGTGPLYHPGDPEELRSALRLARTSADSLEPVAPRAPAGTTWRRSTRSSRGPGPTAAGGPEPGCGSDHSRPARTARRR